MPGTFISLLIALAAVLPGFVTVELTQRQRAVQSGADAQSVVLRALFYALLVHLVWSWWTWDLVRDLLSGGWDDSLLPVLEWAVVVLVLSPIAVGLPLNHVLRAAESKGTLSWWHYALGGRDLHELWAVDAIGRPVEKLAPARGMWVAKEEIAELYVLDGDPTDDAVRSGR